MMGGAALKDPEKIAYCGLYCPRCSYLVACETADRKHLLALPERYEASKQQPLEDCFCEGCRVQTDICHCDMKPCAERKGLLTCADCKEFPCALITAFGQEDVPHHRDAVQNLYRIREVGYDQWLCEMEALAHCACGERQSWYYRCKSCNK